MATATSIKMSTNNKDVVLHHLHQNNESTNNNKPLILSSSLSSCYSSSSASSTSSSLSSVKMKPQKVNKPDEQSSTQQYPKTYQSYQFSLPADNQSNRKIPFRPINTANLIKLNAESDDQSATAAALLALNKLERNYSYIEAMKDDSIQLQESFFLNKTLNVTQQSMHLQQQAVNTAIVSGGKLLIKNTKNNKIKKTETINEDDTNLTAKMKIIKTKQSNQKQHMSPINNSNHCNQINENNHNSIKTPNLSIKQSLSPLYSSSSTSTCSSTSSNYVKPTNTATNPVSDIKTSTIKTLSTNETANNSNLSKSKSQSSILNLFKNTFSPFSIRKWRSKSRDKLAHETISIPPDQSPIKPDPIPTEQLEKKYLKNQQTTNSIKLRVKERPQQQQQQQIKIEPIELIEPDFNKLLNKITPITSTNDIKRTEESASANVTPTSTRHILNNSNNSSPQTERQLSYLKLACFVNGYDSFSPKLKEKSNDSFSNDLNLSNSSKLTSNNSLDQSNSDLNRDIYIGMKSFETLNNSERFYDLKKKTVSSTVSLQLKPIENSIEINNAQLVPVKLDDVIVNDHAKQLTVNEPKLEQDKKNIEIECNQLQITTNELIKLVQDGDYYIKLLDENTIELNSLCKKYQQYTDPTSDTLVQNEDALGQIQTTIGKAQLLVSQKFKQFRGLCVKNMNDKLETTIIKEGEFLTRDEDLAGFWDMVCLQIEDIQKMFAHLEELKSNEWQIIQPVRVVKKLVKKSDTTKTNVIKTVSNTTSRLRADAARQRLIEAKKNAALIKQQQQEEQNIEILQAEN